MSIGQNISVLFTDIPAGNYMFKVSNRDTRTRCEICSKLTIKAPHQRQWLIALVFLLLNLSRNTSWDNSFNHGNLSLMSMNIVEVSILFDFSFLKYSETVSFCPSDIYLSDITL